jgi:multidrug efflux pump subunit AcrA (membrane-fusion protein)
MLILSSCADSSNQAKEQIEEDNVPEYRPIVQFVPADTGFFRHTIPAKGIIESDQIIPVTNRMEGYVVWMEIGHGDFVRKGDTLLLLENKELKLNYLEKLNAYNTLLQNYEASRNSYSLDTPDSLLESQFGLTQSALELEALRLRKNYLTITAPISGRVELSQGSLVNHHIQAGQTLFQIVDTKKLYLKLSVLEIYKSLLKEGQKVTLTEQPATKAVITGIGSLVNEEENMIRIDAVLRDEPDGKFVHSKVWAEITTKIVSGEIRVPREAVIERNGRPLVFRLDSDNNRVEWIYIDEYEENNEWAILKTGRIRVGDLIAVDGHYNLSHFQNVLPTRTLPTDRN